jgi:hypothetical protein
MLNTAIKAVFLSESVMVCLCRLSGDSIAKIPCYLGRFWKESCVLAGEDVLVTRDLGLMASAWCSYDPGFGRSSSFGAGPYTGNQRKKEANNRIHIVLGIANRIGASEIDTTMR